jgi:hypothetical protein
MAPKNDAAGKAPENDAAGKKGALLFTVKSHGHYDRGGLTLTLREGETVELTPDQFKELPQTLKDKLVPLDEVQIRKPL